METPLQWSFCTCNTLPLFLSSPKWIPSFCSSSNPFQCQLLFKLLLYSSQIIPCLRKIEKITCANHNSLCFKVPQILKPLWQHLAGHGADRTHCHTCWGCVLNTDMWRPQLLRNGDLVHHLGGCSCCMNIKSWALIYGWYLNQGEVTFRQTRHTFICYSIQEPRSRSHKCVIWVFALFLLPRWWT